MAGSTDNHRLQKENQPRCGHRRLASRQTKHLLCPLLSRPDHREHIYSLFWLGQGVTRVGYLGCFMSMLCSSFFYYVGVLYDSQLEAAGNRRL